MLDFTVAQRGTDTSGRPIFMSEYMHSWWLVVVDRLGWEPVIVQGAWMSLIGGGAAASAGYHDRGGCLDLRTHDLSPERSAQLVRVLRECGAAGWRRDAIHGGMDPHLHLVLGADHDLAPGAAQQWIDYRNNLDGLASRGRDYERRPSPLVTIPPEEMFMLNDADKQWIAGQIQAAVSQAVAANKLDVGKAAKWSDDTVAKSLLASVAQIKLDVAALRALMDKD